ncbi:heterokaryon incompatibility protein [Pyrenochaeta sp. MPI-SDFR-AT-0127]|nr:heterokaryon incompatibility protein [Pyrenochaeta sp. MPI-SDFR-AT-0127]
MFGFCVTRGVASRDNARYSGFRPSYEFRLVRLQPQSLSCTHSFSCSNAQNNLVICEIEHALRSCAPPYIALSYTWDQTGPTKPIVINNELHKISANVVEALCHLRSYVGKDIQDGGRERDVLVWVDQLCINQIDYEEKNHQVRQMLHIYSEAAYVVSWLGLSADNSDLLIAHLKKISAAIDEKNYAEVLKTYADTRFLRIASAAFSSFCSRKYWTRLWILQEFAVAQDVILMCGGSIITYTELREFLVFLNNMPQPWPEVDGMDAITALKIGMETTRAYTNPALSFLQGVFTRRRRYQLRHAKTSTLSGSRTSQQEQGKLEGKETLFRVLVTSLVLEMDDNHPETSHPNDRIFSLLGLAEDATEYNGFPDYKRGCEDIYQEAARQIFMQGHIDLLSYCQFPRGTKVASWAPDWRMKTKKPCIKTPWLSQFAASGDTLAQQDVTVLDENTITMVGVAVDTIKETGGIWNPDWLSPLDVKAALAYIGEILALCKKSVRIHTHNEELDTACIAIADCYNNVTLDQQRDLLIAYRQAIETMQMSSACDHLDSLGLQIEDKFGLHMPWYMWCLKHLHSRRTFISHTGFVGLAPMHVLPGDEIVLFMGGKAAYVIRGREEVAYELVGESYVHGIMYGEFLKLSYKMRTFTLR